MLGNGRLLHAEAGDNVAYGSLIHGEKGKNVTTARFGDSIESVGVGGRARHETNIYPYRNMSSAIFGWADLGVLEDSRSDERIGLAVPVVRRLSGKRKMAI
jgi:hypothetical protein